MSILNNKIDFVGFVSVEHANPNGDPLNGNRPRDTVEGLGEISDVCLKRKIRNRLIDLGESVFVQSDDKNIDGYKSLKERVEADSELKPLIKGKGTNSEEFAEKVCEKWLDVRAFGQVFAFKGTELSVGVRGPVSIHPAFSLEKIGIESIQITKSVNSVTADSRSSDTMGMKHRVKFGVYKIKGSINCQLAEKTGFTEADAEKIKEALATLFDNDSSAARPDGSMNVEKLFWFKHNCKNGQYSSAKVHKSVKAEKLCEEPVSADDYKFYYDESLEGLVPEVLG
ncbi:MAG: type I-C CRISPR-associated protein Cas7/Csd2 [Ruminococcus sp.]|nr:type I-C CRISPR-associated protein Cas7/Csd2 [Ruminococcus sp.]